MSFKKRILLLQLSQIRYFLRKEYLKQAIIRNRRHPAVQFIVTVFRVPSCK